MSDFDIAKVLNRQNFAIAGSMIIEAGSPYLGDLSEYRRESSPRQPSQDKVKGAPFHCEKCKEGW